MTVKERVLILIKQHGECALENKGGISLTCWDGSSAKKRNVCPFNSFCNESLFCDDFNDILYARAIAYYLEHLGTKDDLVEILL